MNEAPNEAPIDPESLLPRFGLQFFRPGQREVIASLAAGEDVLCVMPTGGGKSLCYQLPALARKGTTIVVSPLIALMKDQVDTLQRRGISATLINSSLSPTEQEEAMQKMAAGALDLVYVAPERLRNTRFLDAVAQAGVTLLAIDEAHCASEWGHDFRPDYARLGHFRNRYLGGVQTIALTATATPHVRQDIKAILEMKSPREFVTGFARDNLRFSVEHFKSDREKNEALIKFLASQSGTGIIYASTRKRCEELAEWLPEKTRKRIGVYHAGLEAGQRRAVQDEFMSGNLSAIVATNAFGMGIDKSDIRYVVHYNIPGSLEAYYQEAGRAGRDGKMSECRLLFAYADRYVQEFFIENRYPSPEVVRKVYEFLLSRDEDPIELTLEQVRAEIKIKETAESVGTAEALLAKAGVLKRLDNSVNTAVIRIDSDLPTLVDLLPREAKIRRKVLRAAEKLVGNHRGEDVYVRPQRLADVAGVDREQLVRTLRELVRLKQFDYVPPFRGRAVHITQRGIPFDDLKIDFEELARRKDAEFDKLEAVIEFARTSKCRQRAVLDYFGDPNVSDCMRCDRCDPAGESMGIGSDSISDGTTGSAMGALVRPASKITAAPVVDYDVEAFSRGIRIVLSGIARMHGRFGKAMIAQMLGGSNNKKIQQWKLNRLSTYGMLSGLKQPQLSDLIDAMIESGLASQTEVDDRRPTVKLTPEGDAVMRATQPIPVTLRIDYPLAKRLAFLSASIERGDVSAEAPVSDSARMPAVIATPTNDVARSLTAQDPAESKAQSGDLQSSKEAVSKPGSTDSELVDRLKRWRGKTSAALAIPAYRVLSNATIDRIAAERPQSIEQLQAIQGVGPATIEQFGYDVMNMILRSSQEEIPSADLTPSVGLVARSSSARDRADVEATPRKQAKLSPPAPSQAAPSLVGDSLSQVSKSPPPSPSQPVAVKAPSDSSLAGSSLANSAVHAVASAISTGDPTDAYWTWRLFRDGYTWDQVCQVRCRDSKSVAQDLILAAKTGHTVQAGWLNEHSEGIAVLLSMSDSAG